jgi:hypothetical protein
MNVTNPGPFFRLRELTVDGDTVTVAVDSLSDGAPSVTFEAHRSTAVDDSVRAALILRFPDGGAPPAGGPEYVIFTPAAFATEAHILAGYWLSRDVNAAVIALEDIGGAQGIKGYIAANQPALKTVLLFGDANDAADQAGNTFWNNAAIWAAWGAPKPTNRISDQSSLNFIPMYSYHVETGDPKQSMASYLPYAGSDWGYVDFDGDGFADPGFSIGRAPVSSSAEALAFVQKTMLAASQATSPATKRMVTLSEQQDVNGLSGTFVASLTDSLRGWIPTHRPVP